MKFQTGQQVQPANERGVAQISSELLDGTPLARFNTYFETRLADSAQSIRVSQAIRYQVYCVEHPHEKSDNAAGLEIDEFDSHSVHGLLIHRASTMATGTVRLVLPLRDAPESSFAVQAFVDPQTLQKAGLPLLSTAEISRFCISQQFRRRVYDTPYGELDTISTEAERRAERRSGPLMRLGLMQAIVRMSSEHRLTHWCALMEPTLLRMLDAMGVHFTRIGGLVQYHGLRQPCTGNIAEMLDGLKREHADLWDVIKSEGVLAN
jgi:N-acyl amino acid synthase of PEP-CTERM/exosortase system